MSLALTMAGAPKPPSRTSSLRPTFNEIERPHTACSKDISLYRGKSDRPLGWKPRKSSKNPALDSTGRGMTVKKWDGAARSSSSWDGLRRVRLPAVSWGIYLKRELIHIGSRIMVSRCQLPRSLVWTRSVEKRSSFQSSYGRTLSNKLSPSTRKIFG
jgi:hypothetical protein